MGRISRRRLFQAGAAAPGLLLAAPRYRRTAIRIEEVRFDFEDYTYRTPMKFAGILIDRATILNVRCAVLTGDGRVVQGFGSMKMGNTWSFRSQALSYDDTLNVMRRLAAKIAPITSGCREYGHPIDLNHLLEPEYLKAAEALTREMRLPEPIPKLCTLVTACAFDAAVHDALGKAHRRSCYQTYGPEFLPHDLAHYLDREFRGEYPADYLRSQPVERLPLYHLVGGADAITASDLRTRVGDGLPETLGEWIRYNGLTHFKIKMLGNDLDWDVARTLAVHREVEATHFPPGAPRRYYSVDFNEMCPNVDYVIEFLNRVRESSAEAFERIQYIEQPTKRDLRADRANRMHRAAKIKPVVIDESLTDFETLLLARDLGYSGVALKACKGQSQSILMASATCKYRMFRCVQDLSCPGASLIHSAGLAAHVPGVVAIEANARQFVPVANEAWVARFPGIFAIEDGHLKTGTLNREGLSAVQ